MSGEFGRVLRELAESWTREGAPVSGRTRDLIEVHTTRLAEGEPAAERVSRELAELLRRLLPEGYPAAHVLARVPRGAVLDADVADAAQTLLAAVREIAPLDDLTVRELAFWTEEEALSAPSLSLEQLAPGTDPDDPGMLRLERWDGTEQWPVFQFDASGELLSVVREVNLLLDVEHDPWGAAGWWLSRHGGLGGVPPADALGSVPGDLLLAAARALVEED